MVKSFMQKLYEAEINQTELALSTESFSDEIQSIIEKVTNLKTKNLAELVKSIRYSGDTDKADSFNETMTQNLDAVIQAATEAKNNIDNNVVALFQGDDMANGDMGDDMSSDDELGGIDDDFGGDIEEFSDDKDYSEDEDSDDMDLSDIDFGEVDREMK